MPSTFRFVGAVASIPSSGRFDPLSSFNFARTRASAGLATNAPTARPRASAFAIGRTRLTDLRRFHVSAFVAALTEDGRGATTVRRIVAVLRAALADAARDDRIEDNPARGVRLPTEDKEQFEPWEPDQVGLFLDTAATHRLGDLFTVAVFTGMRRGELIGLRWSDVDLTRRVLTVRTARVQVGDTVVETTPKSQSSRRVLELDDATVGALVSWRLDQDGERDAWGGAWDDGGVGVHLRGRPPAATGLRVAAVRGDPRPRRAGRAVVPRDAAPARVAAVGVGHRYRDRVEAPRALNPRCDQRRVLAPHRIGVPPGGRGGVGAGAPRGLCTHGAHTGRLSGDLARRGEGPVRATSAWLRAFSGGGE